MKKRIAFYGGTFDPVHRGHMDVALGVTAQFGLEEFVFVPAFHAPHKKRQKPTSAFHRFAMLCEASDAISGTSVSTIEVEQPETPFTIETIGRLKAEYPHHRIFFVIGADSWAEITTWREWERVLTEVDVIVVTRPGYDLGFEHVTAEIRDRIVDLRGSSRIESIPNKCSIFITDAAYTDISATDIREMIRSGVNEWRKLVAAGVSEHIDKYSLYD
ncbi:MAG: nicotinate-nucleotide adenylyltransferase [Acidobacteriota bacterium]|nr:nicotinate-nucleotide adenylyltransferase [Acidobacteriota bacterium]MDH3530380.1 nicotinate-nucleotide adenylyltransferase [Acidobacteriota bacterium]